MKYILLATTVILTYILCFGIDTVESTNTDYHIVDTPLLSECSSEIEPISQPKQTIHHTRFPVDDVVQLYVQYAYEISGRDMGFVGLLQAENSARRPHKQSDIKSYFGANGREDSWGFCQIHKPSHPDILGNELFRTDRKRQMNVCLQLYHQGVYFGGKEKAKDNYNLFLKITI